MSREFLDESKEGKMFGVLVVEAREDSESQVGFLAGYSGQICGRSDWPQFVPAVVDYLQPDGYFKTHEREISKMNQEIGRRQKDEDLTRLHLHLQQLQQQSQQEIEAFRRQMDESKALRDNKRRQLEARRPMLRQPDETCRRDESSNESQELALIRESQFQKAELRRIKKRWREVLDHAEADLRQKEEELERLMSLRRERSDALQRWLFDQFVMLNGRGERMGLRAIFAAYGATHGQPSLVPPSGTGECCEPRLLQQAYRLGLRPLSMAMFWWGRSPRQEVRHSGRCYPACLSKCKPLLTWMLQGVDVMPNPLEQESHHTLEIIYEDEAITVVCKPAGMLSVPGKSGRESVESVMRQRLHLALGPIIVHRLDMDTSGLMVVAHSQEAYQALQREFLRHEVHKRYEALLEHPLPLSKGVIRLPLRPDLNDRPRQVVDDEHGRPAVTRYEVIGDCRVSLWPETGRTHQLRVHCAHREGLADPIRGDALYGSRADRLYLHAASLTLRHPLTGQQMTFEAPVPF